MLHIRDRGPGVVLVVHHRSEMDLAATASRLLVVVNLVVVNLVVVKEEGLVLRSRLVGVTTIDLGKYRAVAHPLLSFIGLFVTLQSTLFHAHYTRTHTYTPSSTPSSHTLVTTSKDSCRVNKKQRLSSERVGFGSGGKFLVRKQMRTS